MDNAPRTTPPQPPEDPGSTLPPGGPSRGGSRASGTGSGGTRYQQEDWKDSQVISKTPSGIGRNDFFTKEDVAGGTLYGGDNPSQQPAGSQYGGSQFGSRSRFGGASSISGGLEPGMDFGPRFRIDQLLGEGGMGKVYKAFDKELGRTVALKILQPELTKDPSVIMRFKQELLLASKISHRNILRIHDLSDFEGIKFITMAFIEGRDLNQILKEDPPFSVDRTMKIGRQLCDALDAAHSEGVVHRDFKPHNVLVAKNDHAYVSDFGLATSLETAKMGMTRTGAFVGTPRYMSPEQVEGKTVDSRSDLYSLGLVLYEMACGTVPFSGESTWQVMYQRVKDAPKDIREVNAEVPDYLANIIMHCLEKEAEARYQSAKEIIADMDAHRAPDMSRTSFSTSSGAAGSTQGSSQSASQLSQSRTVQFTVPSGRARWIYASAGGVVLLTGLFLTIPQTRHLIFKPAIEVGGESVSAGAKGLPPLSQGKFVAVLPFRILGDSSKISYVADGLSEALSARLFQLDGVHVAASTESTKDDGKLTNAQIAKKLGANMIVHGVVQGAGDQLQISVKLENVPENKVVWAENFTGVSADLLAIEDKIYGKLSDALESKPTSGTSALGAHPTENVDAYDLYLRGKNALRGQQDPQNIQVAINYFNSALQKDPSFALAYSGLADASLRMYREKKEGFWSDKALHAAQRAQQLNDKLPEVHFSLGSVYSASGQNAQAVTELKRALELAPNSDEAYRRLGNALLAVGQTPQAIQNLQKAVEINPYYWVNVDDLGNAYFTAGDYEKALKQFQQVTQLEPDNAAGYDNVGSTYSRMGKYQESLEGFQKALKIQPYAATYSNLGTSYFYLKRYPEAVQMFEKAVELNPSEESYMGNLADGYRAASQQDKAKATYDKAIALGLRALNVNPRDADTLGRLALYYAKKGEPGEARQFLARAKGIAPSNAYLMYIGAVLESAANRQAEAVAELKKAIQKGMATADIESDPEFDALRNRPDYQALIKQSGTKK